MATTKCVRSLIPIPLRKFITEGERRTPIMNSLLSNLLDSFSLSVDLTDFLMFVILLIKKNPSDKNKDKKEP